MSRRLKALAKELEVPIILLSQLSRKVEGRADKRPVLSDLRESGSIEQDADMVIFPYRKDYYETGESSSGNEGILIIAKNRHGTTGDIEFYHNETMTEFSDIPFDQEPFMPPPPGEEPAHNMSGGFDHNNFDDELSRPF